jgi:hypothetical protein
MELFVFLAHFVFIGGTFAAGVFVGYRFKDSVKGALKFLKR